MWMRRIGSVIIVRGKRGSFPGLRESLDGMFRIATPRTASIWCSAEFWIRMGNRFIHIRYLPLFEDDVYKGVIEVSQDIAPLRGLEGEKRLLDE
jgi:hypothetical protein